MKEKKIRDRLELIYRRANRQYIRLSGKRSQSPAEDRLPAGKIRGIGQGALADVMQEINGLLADMVRNS